MRYRLLPQDPEDEFEALLRQAWGTRVKVDVVMALLGLAHCAETPCGDQLMRGISGGERKRLTTAEMLVGGERGWGVKMLYSRCWWVDRRQGVGGGQREGRGLIFIEMPFLV